MACWLCGEIMEPQRVPFRSCASDRELLVTNVPAMVCTQCGERSFGNDVLAAMERIRDGEAPPPRILALYTYDFDEAAVVRDGGGGDCG